MRSAPEQRLAGLEDVGWVFEIEVGQAHSPIIAAEERLVKPPKG
jgi:hypothetical protein